MTVVRSVGDGLSEWWSNIRAFWCLGSRSLKSLAGLFRGGVASGGVASGGVNSSGVAALVRDTRESLRHQSIWIIRVKGNLSVESMIRKRFIDGWF